MNLIFKRNLFIIFAIFVIISFITLAIWQIHRKSQKDALISEIHSQTIMPSINFDNREEGGNVFYRKYLFKGKFIKQNYYIYGSNFESQKNGYFIASPFLLKGGKKILVIKGWSQYPNALIQDNFKEFEGIIIKKSHNKYAPFPNLQKNIYYSFDLDYIANNINIESQYFVISTKEMMGLEKINISKFTNIYNRHTEYIITWFTLAFFTFIMTLMYWRK